MSGVFFDTWAFLALANRSDAGHVAALDALAWIEDTGQVGVTSDYVIDETLTGLHAAAGARVALSFLEDFEAQVEHGDLLLLPIDSVRRGRALRWFRRLAPDTPRLSFTDCTSFALIEELKIAATLTADRHFAKAGRAAVRLVDTVAGRLVFRRPPG